MYTVATTYSLLTGLMFLEKKWKYGRPGEETNGITRERWSVREGQTSRCWVRKNSTREGQGVSLVIPGRLMTADHVISLTARSAKEPNDSDGHCGSWPRGWNAISIRQQ